MMEFLLEYWAQAALVICVLGGVWLVVRAVREHAPYLLAPPGTDVTVEVGEEGVTLHRSGRKRTMSWREVAVVRVRTTGDGPFAEDLYLEFEATSRTTRMRVPSGAGGFDRLLESVVGCLPGFDMERVIDATMRMEKSEHVVWQRG